MVGDGGGDAHLQRGGRGFFDFRQLAGRHLAQQREVGPEVQRHRRVDEGGARHRDGLLRKNARQRVVDRHADWRPPDSGAVSHLKRSYGLRRTRLKGHAGAQTWVGWAVLAYNLDTLAIRAAR